MGYKNKTTRLDFDDLGDGCYVVIKNPKLLTADVLDSDASSDAIQVDASGQPVSIGRDIAQAAGEKLMAALVVEWCVWDVDTDEPLPVPGGDISIIKRLPIEVVRVIGERIGEALNPGRTAVPGLPPTSTSTASTPATS